ncbi:GNAT family N-acetyltransferase [Marivita sp. S0852]|uniref:GNAT family N-acetyltransferase n=1 Tax=Marivita sp. S0852 TaxID=3373893 RepID=UPI003982C703
MRHPCADSITDSLPRSVTLKSGARMTVRMVTREDHTRIQNAFAHLSDDTRYMRFLYARQDLPASDIDHLTNWQQRDDVVLGGVIEKSETPVGLARFMRLMPQGTKAEFAVTVVDAFQGDGAGSHLLYALATVAEGCGIETFTALIHRNNHRMRHLLARFEGCSFSFQGMELNASVPVASILNYEISGT